jgi:hypothetical protein
VKLLLDSRALSDLSASPAPVVEAGVWNHEKIQYLSGQLF